MKIRRILFIIAAALIPLVPPSSAAAQQADVIRGRITGPDSAAIEGVTITVTSISGNVSRTAKTDRNGRYTVTFPSGDGDYMVKVAALGYGAKNFEIKRAADEDILIADARLSKVGAILDAVQVRAERQKVDRNQPPPPDISGTETPLNNQAVPANLMGDLAAMAASLPGVQSVPGQDGSADGYSVLGLGADQNNATLNGMQFGGSSLPRDASVSSSLITSPYDVSRGGFSGGQLSLRTRSGSNFKTRGMSLNVDAPQMQWSDRAAQSLGQEYTNVSLGGTVSGPLKYDKAFYNMSYQLGRRASDLQTLLNTNASGFEAIGLSSDSVTRLLSILNTARIPTNASASPSNRLSDNGSLFGSVDIAPPSSSSGQAVNISFNGNWSKQNPTSGFATESPAHSGDRTSWRGGVQARQNMYKGGLLRETSLGVSGSQTESNPFLRMPTGIVRVNSDFADGTSGVQNLLFGGSQSSNSTQTTNSVAFMNQLSWFSTSNKHRLKLTTEARRDGSVQEQASNLLGTFAFNSLADLQANAPASFSRMLGSHRRDVNQLVAAVSLGDSWRRTSDLQIQYGVRVDANKFLNDPQLNPDVESAFGVKNDAVPNKVYFSPRVGFSWTYGKAAQIAGFEGAFRGPRAVVRGGIGVFQNSPSTGTIGTAIDNTGLPSAVQQITCVGSAAPVPDWDAYGSSESSIPNRCADGSTGTVFASSAPNVTLFSKDYRAPRSIRSNLQWNGPVLNNRFNVTVDGTVSLNHNQSSFTDLNFAGVPRFALESEDNRLVFVQPTGIVPSTGAVSPIEGRKNTEFARVSELLSDLKSQSAQLTFRLSPNKFSTNFNWGLSYVYSNVREQFRGFSSTAGNPLNVNWGRASFDSRHQLVYNLGYNFFDWVRVSWFGQFRSGSPFTPMVASDINGDGYANDRAFIPSSSGDPLSSSIQSLITSGSPEAKKCLAKQLGQIAGRNSCQGPWVNNASMSISFNPVKVRMPQRATLSFQLSNPLGAADLMLHGSSNLHGWGQPVFPDQQLLYVRGFNPATRSYTYEVNQRFGSTNSSFGAFRNPVTLTAMMRFDVGPTRERQTLTQQLDRGRRTQGTKTNETTLRLIYGNGGLPNPLASILRQADSLRLTGTQADSLASLNRAYTIKIASLWTPLAHYYADLPDTYDRDIAYDKYMEARKQTIDYMIQIAPEVKGLLTAEQRRKLPPFISSYLEPRYLASIRSGTATFTSNSIFGAGPVFAGGDVFVGAGGGTRTVIIRQ
jgi:hypothetical protein